MTRNITVSFELTEDIEEEEARQIQILLLDALYEFRARRFPAPHYVADRYPDGYLGDHRNDNVKIEQVQGRNRLAKLLHGGIINTEWIRRNQ